jgi:hypothetical protein
MTSALFNKAKESFISQNPSIDMDTDDIKVVGVDHGTDTPVPATDQFLSDITAGARIFTSGNLASKTVTGGVFDAADVTVTAVTGNSIESLVIYKDTTVAGTSPLVAFIDTATGLPFTPNGGDLTIQWDNGASKIFAI